MLAVTDKERVMLLFDVIVPVPHCTLQWVFSAVENRLNATPITATKKLAETATHKTSSNGIFTTSLRDSDASHYYIVADNGTESASYWIGLFIA